MAARRAKLALVTALATASTLVLVACASRSDEPTPAGSIDGQQAYSITGTMSSWQDPHVLATKRMLSECSHGSPILRAASGQDLAPYGRSGGVWVGIFTCSKLGS